MSPMSRVRSPYGTWRKARRTHVGAPRLGHGSPFGTWLPVWDMAKGTANARGRLFRRRSPYGTWRKARPTAAFFVGRPRNYGTWRKARPAGEAHGDGAGGGSYTALLRLGARLERAELLRRRWRLFVRVACCVMPTRTHASQRCWVIPHAAHRHTCQVSQHVCTVVRE